MAQKDSTIVHISQHKKRLKIKEKGMLVEPIELIKIAMRKRGINQHDLSAKIFPEMDPHKARIKLKNILIGNYRLRDEYIKKIAKALDYPIETFREIDTEQLNKKNVSGESATCSEEVLDALPGFDKTIQVVENLATEGFDKELIIDILIKYAHKLKVSLKDENKESEKSTIPKRRRVNSSV